jgi:hypothetical protein
MEQIMDLTNKRTRILPANNVLNSRNWLYFKLYRLCRANDTWKTQLDWYHEVLRSIVRPWVARHTDIRYIFFGIYGPENHSLEANESEYVRKLGQQPAGIVSYIRPANETISTVT